MRTLVTFAERQPKAYLAACLVLGTALRLAMCHGDWGRFFDPMYPLLRR